MLSVAICAGRDSKVASLPPGVEINVQAQPQKATIGDPIQIDFDITLPKGYQASLPKLAGQIGDFALLQVYPGPSIPSSDTPALSPKAPKQEETLHHRARVVAALYRIGEFEFPSLQIAIHAPDGREFPVFSRPVKIQTQSVLSGQDVQLKPLKRQADIQEPAHWLLWFALAFLLLTIAGLAWWFYRHRRRRVLPQPRQRQVDPLAVAEADLRDLIRRNLLESGYVKQYYVALSDITKRILEAGYTIQTIEKTTSEIMTELQRFSTASEADELRRTESVLLACDMVKFAKYVPSKMENEAATNGTLGILDSVKRRRHSSSTEGKAAVAEVP